MKRVRKWILPILTGVTVTAAILLPSWMSGLGDQRLMGKVHAETLSAENNLHIQTVELRDRIGLLAQWMTGSDSIVTAEQEMKADLWEDLESMVREELQYLADMGVIEAGSVSFDFSVLKGRQIYLQKDNIRTSYIEVKSYIESEEKYVSMILDGESGRALTLNLAYPHLKEYCSTPEKIGDSFLERLELSYDQVSSSMGKVIFYLTESDSQYYAFLCDHELCIMPIGAWGTQGDTLTYVKMDVDSPGDSDIYDSDIYDSDGTLIQN